MKRLFAFMMVLAMVLSMGVTAFATEGPGSITISNATVGHTYNLYKIFDATVSADKKNIAYSIDADDAFFAVLFGADGKTANPYFAYNAETGSIAKKEGVKDDDLIKYLNDLMYVEDTEDEDKDGNTTEKVVRKDLSYVSSVKATTETVNFTGLEYGYYLITSTLGSTVTINSTKPHADVIDKNQTSGGLDKLVYDAEALNEDGTKGAWVEDNSVNVGDVVNFKIDFTATNYEGDKKVTEYTLKDNLDPAGWAAIDLSTIEIKIGNKTLVKNTDWTLTSGDANGFVINFPWQNADGSFKHDATVTVTVTYSATVLEAAATNAPAVKNNTAEFKTERETTETRLYNLGYTKIDGADAEKNPLEGATFGLYSDKDCKNPVKVKATGAAGIYVYDKTAASNEVTGAQVVIKGLKEGTYYLKELVAPDGYNKLAGAIEVKLDDTKTDEIEIAGIKYVVSHEELDIENNKGVELPSTGGEGTMKLITIGTIIAIGFAVLLITNKKMTIYQD